MRDARVVLFDIWTDGHHVKYVRYLAQYLLDSGCEVAFVTLKRDKPVDLLLADLPRLQIYYLAPSHGARIARDPVRLFLQMWKALTLCYRFAKDWRATHVCVMSVDYCELPLLLRSITWRGGDWRSFGILIWPYSQLAGGCGAGLARRSHRAVRRWALQLLLQRDPWDGLFVHTEWAKASFLCNSAVRSQLEAKVVVVPDPCDPLNHACSGPEARTRLSLPIDKCVLLFFGPLRWDKGIDILLKAFAELDEDIVLVVAGQEDYVTAREVLAYKRSLRNPQALVARIGYVLPDEEKLYFIAADAVILPYRRVFRGTSGIMQNAVSAQKPVITTDVGALGDLARKHSLGLVVEPESPDALRDGIRRFIEDRTRIEALVHASAVGYVSSHHWRRMATLVAATFQARASRGPGKWVKQPRRDRGEEEQTRGRRAGGKLAKVAFIGHVGFADYRGIGGMQSYVRRLGDGLARLGFPVDYLVHGAPDDSTVCVAPRLTVRYYRSFGDVFRQLASGGYDHIVRVWLSRWDRVRYAWHVGARRGTSRIHYLWFIVPDSAAKRWLAHLEAITMSREGRLICVSAGQYEAVKRVTSRALLLLPPVPDGFFVQPQDKPLSWPLKVTFVGVLHPDKGVGQVVRLFASLKGDRRFECTIYARHDPANAQQDELHDWLAQQEGLRYIPLNGSRGSTEAEREVQGLLRDADIFIQPYQSLQNTVQTPLLVLEAMASCCVLLTTRVGSISELYGRSQFVIDSPDFVHHAEDLLKGLSLEAVAAERTRISQRVERLRFSAGDIATRFVQEIVEAD